MFSQVLQNCRNNYLRIPCCHNDRPAEFCNCNTCLCLQYDHNDVSHQDTYDCPKKLNYYVLKYGSPYISEIYHYLNTSKVLEKLKYKNINILSLGCGFAPDYYAFEKHIQDSNLDIKIAYHGLDKSEHWQQTTLPTTNLTYGICDLTTGNISFKNYQIIIMDKIVSTLKKYNHTAINDFINNIIQAINNSMEKNSVLIFHDVNDKGMGRDIFDTKIIENCTCITKTDRYYTDGYHPFSGKSWIHIENNNLLFNNDECEKKRKKSVFFEYWK